MADGNTQQANKSAWQLRSAFSILNRRWSFTLVCVCAFLLPTTTFRELESNNGHAHNHQVCQDTRNSWTWQFYQKLPTLLTASRFKQIVHDTTRPLLPVSSCRQPSSAGPEPFSEPWTAWRGSTCKHTKQSPFVSKQRSMKFLDALCEKNHLPRCIPRPSYSRQRWTVTSLQTLRTCNVLSLQACNVLHLLAMTWEHLLILPKQPAKYPFLIQTER